MIFVLEAINRDVNAKIYLNDRLVFAGNDGVIKTTQSRITHLLKPGENLIKVEVSAFKGDCVSPAFKLAVLGGQRGTMPGEETILLKIESENFPPQFLAKKASFEEEYTFDVDVEEISLVSHTAEEITNVEDFFSESKELVKSLQAALIQKDMSLIKEKLLVRNKDLAVVSKMDLSMFEQGMLGFLESLFSSDDWTVENTDYESIQYHLEADGKIMHLYTDITEPLVKATGSGRVFDVDVRVAKIDGELVLVQ